jgi:hypothetical protein
MARGLYVADACYKTSRILKRMKINSHHDFTLLTLIMPPVKAGMLNSSCRLKGSPNCTKRLHRATSNFFYLKWLFGINFHHWYLKSDFFVQLKEKKEMRKIFELLIADPILVAQNKQCGL